MEQMQATGHQVVVVRNNAGEVVHTHEFVDFGDVEPRSEEEILIRQSRQRKTRIRCSVMRN